MNWQDPDQPVFVHGGWMIPTAHHKALLTMLPQFRTRHRLNAAELKWQQLARRPDKSAIFGDVFRMMMEGGAIPFFVVMDKDYITAGKIVETLFDPAYNRSLPMAFSSAFNIKKGLAERLMLAPDLLADFANLLRVGTEPAPPLIERYASRVADFLSSSGESTLGETLRHLDHSGLVDIAGDLGVDVWMRTTTGHSMFGLMNQLEGFLRPRNVGLKIVHDNIVRFDTLLEIVRGTFRESDGSDAIRVGDQIHFTCMPTVKSLQLADSKVEPFIQVADLLCGFIRTVFTRLKLNQELDESELEVCGDLAMLQREFNSWEANVPREIYERIQSLGWANLKSRFAPG